MELCDDFTSNEIIVMEGKYLQGCAGHKWKQTPQVLAVCFRDARILSSAGSMEHGALGPFQEASWLAQGNLLPHSDGWRNDKFESTLFKGTLMIFKRVYSKLPKGVLASFVDTNKVHTTHTHKILPSLKLTVRTWKWMVGRCSRFLLGWKAHFQGLLVSAGVYIIPIKIYVYIYSYFDYWSVCKPTVITKLSHTNLVFCWPLGRSLFWKSMPWWSTSIDWSRFYHTRCGI